MLTTFDVCVEHLAILYFGLVTISGIARSQRFGGGQKLGAQPRWGSGAKPPEAKKHDINFALRITLVNAYYPFYSSHISGKNRGKNWQ